MGAFIIFALVFAFLIAHFLGRKRQIGFGWSFFFCIFLSPIFGFIITMLSKKYYEDNPTPSKGKKVAGWIIIVFFSISVLGGFIGTASGQASEAAINAIFMGIGFIGLGYYLIELGKGKNFNTEALLKVEE